MNINQFLSDHAVLIALAIFWIIFVAMVQSAFCLIQNISEEKRRNQYRVIVDFEDVFRYRLQNRWKTLFGWSKWSGWYTFDTLEKTESYAHEQANARVAKLCIPKVLKDLGVLP